MSEAMKNILKELIAEYGTDIINDPDRLSQLLENRFHIGGVENFQLTFALGYLLRHGWSLSFDSGQKELSRYRDILCRDLSFSKQDADNVLDILSNIGECESYDNENEEDCLFEARRGNLKRISGGISNKPRTMWIRKNSLYNGFIFIAVMLAMCVLFFQVGGERTPAGSEFRIAFFTPFEGQEARAGHTQLQAAQLAVESINRQGGIKGYTMKIIGYNTPASANEAAEYVRSIMKDRTLLAMIASTSPQTVKAIAQVADDISVPLVVMTQDVQSSSIMSDGDKPYLYAFRITQDMSERAKMLAYFAMQGLGKKKVAIFCDLKDITFAEKSSALNRWMKVLGGEVTSDMSRVRWDETDYVSDMGSIEKSSADVLILQNSAKTATKDLVVKAREVGFAGPVIVEGNLKVTEKDNKQLLSGSWWIDEVSAHDPGIRSVLKEYRSLYNENCPDEDIKTAILAYDSVLWIANAFSRAPGYRGEALRHALLSTRNLSMTHATLTVDPRTHGPFAKAVGLVYCDNGRNIFQKRIRTQGSIE